MQGGREDSKRTMSSSPRRAGAGEAVVTVADTNGRDMSRSDVGVDVDVEAAGAVDAEEASGEDVCGCGCVCVCGCCTGGAGAGTEGMRRTKDSDGDTRRSCTAGVLVTAAGSSASSALSVASKCQSTGEGGRGGVGVSSTRCDALITEMVGASCGDVPALGDRPTAAWSRVGVRGLPSVDRVSPLAVIAFRSDFANEFLSYSNIRHSML